jgi:WD40 repeat protein
MGRDNFVQYLRQSLSAVLFIRPALALSGAFLLQASLFFRASGLGPTDSHAAAPPVLRPKPAFLLQGHRGRIVHLLFRPDGKQLVTACEEDVVCLWNLTDGKLLHSVDREAGSDLHCLAYSPDSRLLAIGTSNGEKAGSPGEVVFRSTRTGKKALAFNRQRGGQTGMAFSPDGALLATSNPGYLNIWKVATGKPVRAIPVSLFDFGSVLFSPDSKRVVLCMSFIEGGSIHVYDVSTGKRVALIDEFGKQKAVVGVNRGAQLLHLRFSPDGKRLIGTHADSKVRTWGPGTGRCLSVTDSVRVPADDFFDMAFSPDAHWVATCDLEGTVTVRELSTGNAVWSARWRAPTGVELLGASLAFSADGQWLATAVSESAVEVWDLRAALRNHRARR